MNALEPILARTRKEVARRRRAVPAGVLERSAAGCMRVGATRSFADAIAAPGMSLIAEHKRRSPSAGTIREGLALEQVVQAYEQGGAAALSVVTEGSRFGGSLEDLRAARAAAALPVLRKDFIVDPYQVVESRAAGADAVLLIAAAVSARELSALYGCATDLGLAALVEVHDERGLDVAMALGAAIIGINNRDLTTLTVDPWRIFELLPRVADEDALVVAESGYSRRAELDELAAAGVDGVLIGEALMRSAEIETTCRELTR
jgi:indole-3-glycerol phosphate synthase